MLSALLNLPPIDWTLHELFEIAAAIALITGGAMGALLLRQTLRRNRQVETRLKDLSGAFMDHIEARFDEWSLTRAERDVALFALKGCSLHEIATLRATSEGTVKAQTNAIYRKAGVTGRPQLISLFLEDLIDTAPTFSAETSPALPCPKRRRLL
jgi:DNA-binding NarL/FixJ family response regulator